MKFNNRFLGLSVAIAASHPISASCIEGDYNLGPGGTELKPSFYSTKTTEQLFDDNDFKSFTIHATYELITWR